MLTKNDIIHFYDRYKKNLKKEEQVIARLLQVKDQEEWIDNLKKKSRVMRSLYIENEALLNMYVRPSVSGKRGHFKRRAGRRVPAPDYSGRSGRIYG